MQYIAVLVMLALFSSPALADMPDGNRAFNRGDYETAANEYRESYESRGSVTALVRLAKSLTFLAGTLEGEAAESLYEEAADYAREAVQLAPDDADAHMELARALGRLGQFRGVLQSLGLAGEIKNHLDTALELDPRHDSAMHGLALWHLEVPWVAGGRSGRVRPLFEQAIELDPSSIIHRLEYGEALLRLGEPEAAREQLERALALPARTAADRADQAEAQRIYDENFR